MNKFFALVLALVMALSLTTVAWGVSETTVTTAADLADAVKSTSTYDVVKLGANIELTAPLTVEKSITIDGTKDATSNYTLTYTGATGNRAITVESTSAGVNLTINNLTVAATAQRGINYNTNGKLTLNNVTVGSTSACPTYAVNLPGSSDDAVVSIENCTLYGQNVVNVWGEDMTITITDTGLYCVDNNASEGYAAIFLNNVPGDAAAEGTVVSIEGGSVNLTGSEAGDSHKFINGTSTGKINVSNPPGGAIATPVAVIRYPGNTAYSFYSLQDAVDYANTGDTVTMLTDADDAVAIPTGVNLDKNGYCNGVSAKIGNTKYETLADAVAAAQDGDTIVLTKNNDEDVTVGEEITIDPDGNSYSGTITGTNGLAAVLVNGEYVLQEPANVSVNKSFSNVDTEDWVVVDLTTGTAYDIAEDAEVNKIVYKDIKKTVNGKTTTQYGVTLYGPLTFEGAGAAANGGYAMVVAKESANMQLETAAGKIIFARFITADEYAVYSTNEAQYAYTTLVATDYEEKAANPSKCEDVIVSYYVVGDDYYAAATSNADNTLVRYKNEFVIVGEKLDGEPLVPHVFLTDAGTTCKWTVTNNKITSVKCTCGDTFKIVQDIKGLKAGSYVKIAKTLAGETNFAIVSATTSGITSSGSSSSTDKTVTSAETFDAGIAMYVGMSVMAAAGSAVVIGKKKD